MKWSSRKGRWKCWNGLARANKARDYQFVRSTTREKITIFNLYPDAIPLEKLFHFSDIHNDHIYSFIYCTIVYSSNEKNSL